MKVNIDVVEQEYLRKDMPRFRVGDQVRVTLKIVEGESERLQAFEGTIIRFRGHGLSSTFTVRKISFGVGVERTLPLHSPRIESIEVLRSGHVRRARLYFLRGRAGRAARLDERAERRESPMDKKATSAVPAPTA